MEQIKLEFSNVVKAKEYLASIGMLQEFENKKVQPSHWYAVIQFANQQMAIQNSK